MKPGWMLILAVQLFTLAPRADAQEGWGETNTLSRAIAQKFGGSESQAQLDVDRVFAALRGELMRGRSVVVFGFGTFAVQERRPRRKRHEAAAPRPRKHVRFRAADPLTLELNR